MTKLPLSILSQGGGGGVVGMKNRCSKYFLEFFTANINNLSSSLA